MIKLAVEIDQDITNIQFDEQGTMVIYRELKKLPDLTSDELLLYFKGRAAQAIDYGQKIDKKIVKETDSLVRINVPWDIEGKDLAQQMLTVWNDNSLQTKGLFETQKIAANHFPVVANYQKILFEILATFELVGAVVLFINNNHAEIFKRRKQRGAGADDNRRLAIFRFQPRRLKISG